MRFWDWEYEAVDLSETKRQSIWRGIEVMINNRDRLIDQLLRLDDQILYSCEELAIKDEQARIAQRYYNGPKVCPSEPGSEQEQGRSSGSFERVNTSTRRSVA